MNSGNCGNSQGDVWCESYKNSIWHDYCGSTKDWGKNFKLKCPDTCNVCGYRKEGEDVFISIQSNFLYNGHQGT